MKLNWEMITYDAYTQLYANATPPADFYALLSNAALNETGREQIPFDQYEIEDDKMDQILDEIVKKYKIPKLHVKSFKRSILLGCSPKSKNN